MNKLKSCMNNMCPKYMHEYTSGCCLLPNEIISCSKYITEKPQSAWEIFRSLLQDFELKEIVCNIPNKLSGDNYYYQLIDFIERTSDQDAIKIMKKIKKELKL